MKTLVKIVLAYLMLWGVASADAQVSNFRSFRQTKGAVTPGSHDIYVWGAWEQSETYFSLNIPKHLILVEDKINKTKLKYEIFDKPQKWITKKNYKYINFECMETESMRSYFIRLCEYDTGDFKITVLSPDEAVRYQVIYLKDKDPEINFDDIE